MQSVSQSESVTFASIIIPVRNEEHNILNCLSSIYKQKLPLTWFEVIVVNDHSNDNTRKIIESKQFENLKIIHLSENQMGKKQAITEGIKISRGNLIITTDADCEAGENWLSAIISFYEKEKPKMIVGPVLLTRENSIQQTMQSQEMTVLTACGCASFYWNKPILCNGANLVFEKSAFIEVGGFNGVDKTATGDDIFLMLKIYKKFSTGISYLKSKDAIVYTDPEKSSSRAIKQRKRWASKSFSYGFSHVTWIAILVFFMNFIILFSGILSVINIKFVLALVISFSTKSLVDFMLLYSASSFFEKKINPFIFVFASIVYPFYVSFMGIVSPFTNYHWKGRKS
jgi:cellulose synthase/poly-beta-1,6-N-acetylglucosamine synthase-like glycosyltransferase